MRNLLDLIATFIRSLTGDKDDRAIADRIKSMGGDRRSVPRPHSPEPNPQGTATRDQAMRARSICKQLRSLDNPSAPQLTAELRDIRLAAPGSRLASDIDRFLQALDVAHRYEQASRWTRGM